MSFWTRWIQSTLLNHISPRSLKWKIEVSFPGSGRYFSLFHKVKTALGSIQWHIKWKTEANFTGIKRWDLTNRLKCSFVQIILICTSQNWRRDNNNFWTQRQQAFPELICLCFVNVALSVSPRALRNITASRSLTQVTGPKKKRIRWIRISI